MTYSELDKRSDNLGRHLSGLGIRPGKLVGVFMERCIDMVVALLGIMKAGGTYVPIDPEYPRERIEFMLENASIETMISQKNLDTEFIDDSIRIFDIDTWNPIESLQAPSDWSHPGPDDIAYIIYTSGSTGKPKGVKVGHRALVNFLLSMGKVPGISVHDTLMAVTTLSFDIAGLELYLPLVHGAKVHIISRDTATDGYSLITSLERSNATIMQATPSTWRIMFDAGWKGSDRLKVLCGGEAFPRDLARKLIQSCKEVWNMYGPTETTIWSVVNRLEDPEGLILIGKPIANTEIYILDEDLHLVPIGGAGELYIGGDGVSHGYLDRPELDAVQFIDHPFGESIGGKKRKIYKTGDLCRYHSNGLIEYLSRKDNQIKLRGFRIELGEIESTISTHDSVKQAIVIHKEFEPGDVRMAAYVVAKDGYSIDEQDLRNHVRKILPSYMVPQHFIEADGMPLTPAGKIDRKRLTAEFNAGDVKQERSSFKPPETDIEILCAGIWQKILKMDFISVDDNFFDLGGHSLLAIQIIANIKKQMNTVVPLKDFFEKPTIKDLADYIESHKGTDSKSVVKITKRSPQDFTYLSLQQQRL
jgi:amino acid adenylation domain-containing protein